MLLASSEWGALEYWICQGQGKNEVKELADWVRKEKWKRVKKNNERKRLEMEERRLSEKIFRKKNEWIKSKKESVNEKKRTYAKIKQEDF